MEQKETLKLSGPEKVIQFVLLVVVTFIIISIGAIIGVVTGDKYGTRHWAILVAILSWSLVRYLYRKYLRRKRTRSK